MIRLEDERNELRTQERNLTASIQAALREGSASARAVAEEDALQLQQVRTDLQSTEEQLAAATRAHEASQMSVEALKTKLKAKIETAQRAVKEHQKSKVMRGAADAIVELQSYGVAATADKFLEQVKQEAAEAKAAVEVATGGIDAQAIERDRTARKIKAASILQQFETEMGIARPASVAQPSAPPSVGARTQERTRGS